MQVLGQLQMQKIAFGALKLLRGTGVATQKTLELLCPPSPDNRVHTIVSDESV